MDVDPGRDQEAGVVGQHVDVGPASRRVPSDEAIPAPDVPGRRGPGEAGEGLFPRQCDVLEVLPDRIDIAQVVVLGDEAVVDRLQGGPPHLAQFNRGKGFNGGCDGALIDIDLRRAVSRAVPSSRVGPFGWKPD